MGLKSLLRSILDRLPLIGDIRVIKNELLKLSKEVHALQLAQATNLTDFQLENHPRYRDPKRLLRYAAQVCSQNGEDGMIAEIFRRIGTTNRVFAEVGVGDGSENNTAFLLSQGWTGFWVDGCDAFQHNLQKRGDLGRNCIRGLVTFITKENAAAIFSNVGAPTEFDLLSLDIDQNTYYLWEALASYRPRAVVIEYNASIPPDIDWKVNYAPDRVWDGSHNFGASLKAYESLGRRLGYSLVGCDFVGGNAFFVRDDLAGDLFAKPFTAENHYEPPRYGLLHRRGHPAAILDRA